MHLATLGDLAGIDEDDLEQLNSAVVTMTNDVNATASVARQSHAPNATDLTVFQGRWTIFVGKWNVFFVEHQTFLSRQFDDPEFAALKLEYEQKRDEWTALGQSSRAPVKGPGGMLVPPWAPTALVVVGVIAAVAAIGYALNAYAHVRIASR